MDAKIYKQDYKIVIQFDRDDELYWDVYRKGEPHFIGDNTEELQLVSDALDELKFHIERLLKKKRERLSY